MKTKSIIVVVMILLLSFVNVYAENDYKTLDGVIVQLSDGTNVKVSVREYGVAVALGNNLFNYLKSNNEEPNVKYVSSDNKYIEFRDYAVKYALNNEDVDMAIRISDSVSEEIIKSFMKFEKFDENGDVNLVPLLPDQNLTFEVIAIY